MVLLGWVLKLALVLKPEKFGNVDQTKGGVRSSIGAGGRDSGDSDDRLPDGGGCGIWGVPACGQGRGPGRASRSGSADGIRDARTACGTRHSNAFGDARDPKDSGNTGAA